MPFDLRSSLGVVEEFIPSGRGNRLGRRMVPTTVTIHNTDNVSRGAGAKAHSNFVRKTGYYVIDGKEQPVSWHFSVDDTMIIQHLPLDEVAYHAGSRANASSIAIEICMNPDSDERGANAKAAALAAHLLARMGRGTESLRRHKDWTGKDCPSRLLTSSKWAAFSSAVAAELRSLAASTVAEGEPGFPEVAGTDEIEDHEIDHEALALALGRSATDAAPVGAGAEADPVELLHRVLDGLANSTAAGRSPQLFPGGVTEVALALPGGLSLTVKGPDPSLGIHSTGLRDDEGESVCEAPDDDNEASIAALGEISSQVPASTRTFYAYGSAGKRFATASALDAIEVIAKAYFARTGVRLGIGNVSRRGGGPMPPHSSHRRGIDVDLRVPRADGREAPATWRDPAYSRSRTQQLVEIVRANSVLPVRTILFNDGKVSGVRPYRGHDDHLHVSFSSSSVAGLGDEVQDAVSERGRPFAAPRVGAEVEEAIAASGSARVLVTLARGRAGLGSEAASLAEGRGFSATGPDPTFEACFELPDRIQAESLAAAAVAHGQGHDAKPPPRVRYFPRLGLALGSVARDRIDQLKQHGLTREIHLATEPTRIRPMAAEAASEPRSVEWGIARLGIPRAWKAGFDGTGVVVGHLDTGIDASHPALADALHAFAEFDLTGERIVDAAPRDGGSHGTHTAGTVAGRPVGGNGRFGVAPGCRLASALVIEGGDVVARILGGLEWIVEQNAKVLCMSLGLRGFTTAFQTIVDALRENDVLPVIAVGNEFANSSRSPGNYPNVLSIGAMGSDDRVADFSSSRRFDRREDPLVPDLVAPGVDILSCHPGGRYEKMSGTSMATPHVAGLAAILRQAAAAASAMDVERAILDSCARPSTMPEARANRGVPDVMEALNLLGVRISRPAGARKRTAQVAAQ